MSVNQRLATVTIAACALVGYGVSHDTGLTAGACVLVAGLTLCWALPVEALPLIALTATLVIPTDSLPLPRLLVGFPLGLIPIAVWIARTVRRDDDWQVGRWLAGTLAIWMTASELFAPIRTNKGLVWYVTALVTVCAVSFWARRGLDTERVRRFFLRLATALACYAIVEAFVLKSNPIYGSLYARAPTPLVQHWAVYRATTLMGHPLVNATVFAAALVLAAAYMLKGHGKLYVDVLRVVLLVLGLAATQSRAGFIAAAVGIVFVVMFQRGPGLGGRKALLVALGAVALTALAVALSARNNSIEGRESTAVREGLVKQTRNAMAGTSVLGAGPNEVEAWRLAQHSRETKLPLESSFADLAVSIGIPGLAMFVGLLGLAIALGAKSGGSVPDAGALLALLIVAGGYQALGNAPPLVLIGVFLSGVLAQRPYPARIASRVRQRGVLASSAQAAGISLQPSRPEHSSS
jgi:hypothetical protein